MPKLIVEKGADRGGEIEISPSGSIIVGRETSTGFRLRDSWASRQHFRIEQRDGGGFWLVDLKSLNGTYVNGKRVTEQPLAYGDLIKVGETLFTFIGDGAKDPLIGQRLAGYRIVERVGRGGMGTVYRAEQIDLQRTVAVKVISPEYAKNREFIERFINEARAAAQLNHPNVVQVYDVKRDGKVYFFSMEFMDNGSLQTILGPVKKLPPKQAVKMILDAARGLEYAHSKEIVHRDIKPDNMMVADTGAVKIGDLGLAAGLHERATSEEERYVLGTPHYIAPEQLLGKPADFRSDIYSLGSSLYRLLAGQPPFSGHGVQEIVNKKVREDPVRIEQLVPGLPVPIAKLTARMIERDPEKRFQTMGEAVESLEEIYDRMRSGDKSTVRRAAVEGIEEATPVWKRPAVLGAAAGVLLLLLIAVGWAIFGGDDVGPTPPGPNGGNGQVIIGDPATMLELAELKADKISPDSSTPGQIEEVIKLLDDIVVKFPGSPQAVKAAERKAGLDVMLQAVTMSGALQAAVGYDDEQWTQFNQRFREDTIDPEPIRLVIERYREVAESPKYKETYVAVDAAARADHIVKWLEQFDRMRAAYDEAVAELTELSGQGHWAQAAAPLEAFARNYRPFGRWKFEEDRYNALLWDEVAAGRLKQYRQEAEDAFRKFERDVRALGPRGKFDEAEAMLSERREDFGFLPAFGKLVGDVAEDEKAYLAEQAVLAAREHERKLGEDRVEFDRATRAAYERHTREFRFFTAYTDLKATESRLQTDEYKARLRSRLADLQRAGDFVEAFGNAANNAAGSAAPYVWPDTFIGPNLKDKPITGIDADKFLVKSGVGEVVPIPKAFRDFTPRPWEFLKVLKTWPELPAEDLAVLAMEIGEYAAAAELLGAVEGASAAALLAKVKSFELDQSTEEQAARRYHRIDSLMKAERYEEAATDLGVLQTRFSRTSVLLENQATLSAWELRIEEKLGMKMEEERRLQSLERAEQVRAASRERIDALAPAIEAAVGKAVGDASLVFEGQLVGGLFEYGRGRAPVGKRLLEQAAQLARERRLTDADQIEHGLLAHMFLCEVEAAITPNRDPGVRRAQTYAEGKMKDAQPPYFKDWAEVDFPAWLAGLKEFDGKALDAKLAALGKDARDPKLIWEAAGGLFWHRRNFAEARGWLMVLLEGDFPDFEPVKSGDALYLLAECDLFLFDMARARRAYDDLAQNHPGHPRAKGREHADGATVRVELIKFISEAAHLEEVP